MKEQVVNEWVERGKRDLDVAKLLLTKHDFFDIALFHIHQAVEKYIKGFLIQQGWILKKIHDLELLFSEAKNFNEEFQKYLDFGRKLTAFYYEERYPPGPISSCSKNEMEEMLDTAEEILNLIHEGIKEKVKG